MACHKWARRDRQGLSAGSASPNPAKARGAAAPISRGAPTHRSNRGRVRPHQTRRCVPRNTLLGPSSGTIVRQFAKPARASSQALRRYASSASPKASRSLRRSPATSSSRPDQLKHALWLALADTHGDSCSPARIDISQSPRSTRQPPRLQRQLPVFWASLTSLLPEIRKAPLAFLAR
jgi:hypothetical protein